MRSKREMSGLQVDHLDGHKIVAREPLSVTGSPESVVAPRRRRRTSIQATARVLNKAAELSWATEGQSGSILFASSFTFRLAAVN